MFISFGNINKKSLSYLSQAREGIIIMEIINLGKMIGSY
jgi:hypothetical protein